MATRPPHIREAMPTLRAASTWPPVKTVLLGADGTIWLEVEELDPRHRWQVLNQSGETVGFVDLPANYTLRVASREMLWGIETDADDLQSVVAYRVQ